MTALMSLLFSGCKTQQPAKEGFFEKLPGNDVQAAMPQTEKPTQPSQKQNSISLELPDDFEDYTGKPGAEQYDYLYSNGQMGIGINAIRKPQYGTLEDYAYREADYYRTQATQKDGFWTITYEDPDSNEPQTMIHVFYEDADTYWTVQGFCPSQCYDQYESIIWQYITGVEFTGK